MQKKKTWMSFLSGCLVLAAGLLFSCSRQSVMVQSSSEEVPAAESAVQQVSALPEESESVIWVHVCGAVQQEGVYALPAGSRYEQAIEAAGGFSEDADRTALNLAALAADGEQIRVLSKEEAEALNAAEASAADTRVNINTASKEVLMSLPGIGEARAEAIIAYREEHGEFQSIEDIMQVSGIKEAAFEKLKAKIKVGSQDGKQGFSSG